MVPHFRLAEDKVGALVFCRNVTQNRMKNLNETESEGKGKKRPALVEGSDTALWDAND